MKTLKTRLLASVVTAGVAVIATPAMAQVGTPEAESQASGQDSQPDVVVTGSRIRRNDLTSTSPVTVVSDQEFALQGAINVEQVVNTLPQVLPGLTGFSNNPGNGAVTLNLRALGAQRTLVLVNGRRWMFYDTTQVVDLNTIPQFMLQNVEVSTGGASAVYGSDAVAGVVNFKLRDDLNGVLAGATYNITERGDAASYSADVGIGSNFADDRGNVTLFANYTERKPLFQSARRFSNTAIADGCVVPGSGDPSRSGIGTIQPGGSAIGTCAARGGEVGFVNGGSANTPIATFNAPGGTYIFNGSGGGSRLFQNPADLYNFNPTNYLQLPQERYLLGGFAHYEVADGVEVFSEVSFVNNRVNQELAPTPTGVSGTLQIASPFFNEQTRALLRAQDAIDATPNNGYATTTVNYRFLSAGSRNAEQTRQAYRLLLGVRGDITDKLNYEAYYSYARTNNTQYQQGNVSSSRYRAALTTEFVPGSTTEIRCLDPVARAAGCVPINVFGSGLASPAAVNYVRVNSTNLDISELKNAVASVSGSLFNFGMGADDVAFSLGTEYRQMRSRYIPDTFLSSGDVLGFNAGQPTRGSYDVKEVFGELRVPLVRDGFVHALELTGAARYSDYSLQAVGGTWTYTGGAEFAPIRDIRFRGQYSRAVRAPNVQDLFGGQSTGFPSVNDRCGQFAPQASRTEAVRALCVASGVPAANVFTALAQPNQQIQTDVGGNPNVEEEVSDTYTAGVVISPSFIPRLNVTVDYFNIKVENTIGQLAGGVATAIQLCYDTIQDVNNAICAPFVNRPGFQVRNPQTGALGASAGGLNPQFTSANVGTLKTSGIDMQVDYNLQFGGGQLSFFYIGTWLDKYRSIPITAIPEREFISEGTFGLPKYRHTARVTFSDGPASLSLRWGFEGKTQSTNINNIFNGLTRVGTDPALLSVARLGSYSQFDLTASVDVNDALTFNFGVSNLLDKDPPILGSQSEQANTLPSFYDVLGRQFFIAARVRL
ncbi:TonB-dependent receptor domain-containing protein [Sphingomonas corticis]|jgi:outer membrane receptor protein involved in Fe transport|uniref:TonB-dependent receptor n=1 Tax=Sphingomonas corticis TaxID=2722791 RepID=A0ABX1CL38_9SPHN|nr:TonB-dependent receptor [Sphingomonas corticis]NJR78702.1 TonB-dependent receptor [Sphingomonas corticis]